MATWLRVSTAVDVALGPFVDSTDGFTPETALSLTQAECRLKKNGGAWAQKNNATTAPHEEEGWYEVNLSTTDTDTLGILVLAVYVTGALPVWREFMVVTAAVWDAHMSTGVMPANVTQWLGTAAATPTTAGVPEVDVTHWGSGAVGLGISGTPIVDVGYWLGTLAAIPTVAGVPEVDVTHHLGTAAPALVGGRYDASVGAMAANVMTAAAAAADLTTELQAGLATGAALATVQADTDNIQTRIPAALVSGRMDSSVGAMAADVITAAATATDFSTEVNAAVLAVLGALNVTAASGDPGTTTTIVAYLKQLINTLQGTAGLSTFPAAAVPANAVSMVEVLRQIYDEVAGLNGGALPAAAPTAAVVADAVWDEVLSGHLAAGSTGEALNGAGAAGDPWTTALPGAYGAGSAGSIIGNLDDAVAAVQADTDNIQTRLPAALVGGKMDSTGGGGATAAEVADAVWDEALSGHAAAGSTGEALSDAAAGGGGGGSDPWATPVPGAYAAGTAGHILGNLVNSVWAVNLASITGAAARSPLNALRFLRNKWQVDGTTLTVTTEDDATTAWTATVTHDATAAPVVGNDPT